MDDRDEPEEEAEDGAEDGGGGRGSGTASDVRSRCGSGSVRSGRRRARPGVPGCCGRAFGGPPGRIVLALFPRRSRDWFDAG